MGRKEARTGLGRHSRWKEQNRQMPRLDRQSQTGRRFGADRRCRNITLKSCNFTLALKSTAGHETRTGLMEAGLQGSEGQQGKGQRRGEAKGSGWKPAQRVMGAMAGPTPANLYALAVISHHK